MVELQGLGEELRSYLKPGGFTDARSLDAAFDDEATALDFLLVLSEPGQVDKWLLAEWAEQLADWKVTVQTRINSAVKRSVASLDEGRINVRAKYDRIVQGFVDIPLLQSLEADLLAVHWRSRRAVKMKDADDLGQRQFVEETERLRWAEALGEIITRAGLPSSVLAEKSAHPARALQGAAGTLRARTLRARVRTWWQVREWVFCSTGAWHPCSVACMIDYLYDVAAGGCPPSRLTGVAAALSVVEKRGAVAAANLICENALWKQTLNQLIMEAQRSTGMAVQKAPGYSVKMLISLELFVAGNEGMFFRLVAFIKLLKVWGCLRYNDVQGIRPSKVVFSQEGLRLTLERSKTTGPGKRTGHLFVFVHRLAGYSGADWQTAGMALLRSDELSFDRDYLLPVMGSTQELVRKRFADYSASSGYSKAVLRLLKDVHLVKKLWVEKDVPLITGELVNYWSEHSERHFLPQALASFQVEKSLRDKVGRWGVNQSHQSDDYVLSQRKQIHALQRQVAQELSYRTQQYDEEFIREGILEYLAKKGLTGDDAAASANKVLTPGYSSPFFGLGQSWPLGPWAATLAEDRVDDAMVTASDGLADEDESGPALSELDQGQMWCSVSERGHRRLHRHGSKLCFVRHLQCRSWEPVNSVKDSKVNSMCKFCWGTAKDADSSSGDSSTEGCGT
jgi:hypothetical protein